MKKIKISLVVIVLFTFFLNSTAHAQISSKEVDRLVENAIKTFNVAGVAVAIVKDGKIIHSRGYGVKSIKTKEKVNKHTNFAIASNSKAFTTAALAILIEEGKLSWQDKVKKHIPEFKMYNAYVTENFNIQDLLTHRSGLGLGAGDLIFFPDGADFTIKDVLKIFQYFKPQSAFRTKYDYDNLLYFVAGEVIARVSGKSWEEFVSERIFQPLKMDNTYASLLRMRDKSNMAIPHSTETGEIRAISPFIEIISGAPGGILSNVDDLCNWMLVHLNRGKYGKKLEKELFSEISQNEMWKIHTTLPVNRNPRYNSHFSGYGLGWGLTDIKGNMSVSHTGGLPGMLSRTVLIPDLNLGVIVLTNTANGGSGVFKAVSKSIVDSYLGLDDFDWTDHYYKLYKKKENKTNQVSSRVWETVKNANTGHLNFEDFIGVYEDNWFGKVEVFMKGKQLWFKSYRSPKLNGPMSYYKANTFAIKWEYQDMNADAFAMFNLDEDGKAQSIKMKGISPNIDFSFDFQDLDLNRVKD
ncbi:MAG: serine hydrolase [Acidobacteriota bacterium]